MSAVGHTKWEELAVGHVLSALEPEDEELFADHLRGCDLCVRTVAEMTSVSSHLAYSAEPADPPAALKDSIMDAVRRSERTPSFPSGTGGDVVVDLDERRRLTAAPSRWLRALSAAAAVVALAGMAIWNVNLRDNARLADRALARMARVERLAADPATVRVPLTSGIGAKGTVLARGTDVVVLLDGLPRNDLSSIYVLWYQDEAGGFHAFDTFDIAETDHVNVVESSLDRSISQIVTIAISKEPGRVAPPNPSFPLVQGVTGQTTVRA